MEGLLSFFGQCSLTSYCILTLVCIVLYWTFFSLRYHPRLPPSPGLRLPLIGHMYLLDQDLRKSLRKHRAKLGDIYSMYYGRYLIVVIGSYTMVKEAFLKQAEMFNDKPSLELFDRVTQNRSFVSSAGLLWSEHRRFVLSKLKDFGMGKSKLEGKIHEEIVDLLQDIRIYDGNPFNPRGVLCSHVSNIICHLVFKGKFSANDQRFMGMMTKIEENLEVVTGVANFLPWLKYVPGDPFKFKRTLNNGAQVYEYCDAILAEHMDCYDENDIDDLTSAYIKETRRAENNSENTTMSLRMLSGVIADLFVAGFHTTATVLRWAIPCLVQYPDIQERLYREITQTIGTERLPSLQDKASLGYLEAFTLEVLRFCNLTPVSGLHKPFRDEQFKGFTIPQHAIVIADLDSVFSDPKIWGDPENFRPERFLDEAGNFKKRDEFIAFFLGKRSCIGESLARAELLLFIGAMVQKFRFESAPGETLGVEKVDGIFGLVHTPKPYNVVAIAR